MLKILFSFFVMLLTAFQLNAAITSDDKPGPEIELSNNPNPFSDNTHIKFTLLQDSYVKLCVISQDSGETTDLIDGEMSNGEYGVIFKAPGNGPQKKLYECKLTVETLNNNRSVSTKVIKMIQK